jgi:hypothetical protein
VSRDIGADDLRPTPFDASDREGLGPTPVADQFVDC